MILKQVEIGGYNQSNSPYVRSAYLFDKSDIISVLDPFRHKLPGIEKFYIPFGGIRIKTGTTITRLKFPPQMCIFSQTLKRSDGNVSSLCQFDFPIPASRDDVMEYYLDNMEKQFVCLFDDNNGKSYIVGNEERGARLSLIQTINAVNEHAITIAGTFNVPVFGLRPKSEGINLAVMFPDTDYSTDFSLDFYA